MVNTLKFQQFKQLEMYIDCDFYQTPYRLVGITTIRHEP